MKKQLFLFAMCISIASLAQVSQLGINYQAQIRNSNGVLIADSSVIIRFSLLPGQFATIPSWYEEWTAQTDHYGMVHVVIGQGTKISGTASTFDLVDFTTAGYYLKTELKVGGSFLTLSNEPFQSVPYAKVAGNASPFPAGFIMPFAGDISKIPQGWLLCDGSQVSRSQYSTLYAVILDNWGRGNNSTTFNLPDLRGTFLRGVDGSAGNDPDNAASSNGGVDGKRYAKYTGGNIGNNVGSFQNEQFKSHRHNIRTLANGGTLNNNHVVEASSGTERLATTDAQDTPPGGNETRPKNAYVNFLIKY